MGELVITKAFVIIILGGMGSFPGAIVGGLIIGMAESFGGFYFSTDYKDIIAFVLLVGDPVVPPAGPLHREGSALMNWLQGRTGWALLAVAALAFPLFAQNNYLISVATQAFIMAIAALGLNLITGYTGPVQPGARRLHGGGCLHGRHPDGRPPGAVLGRVPGGGRGDRRAGLLHRPAVAAPAGATTSRSSRCA